MSGQRSHLIAGISQCSDVHKHQPLAVLLELLQPSKAHTTCRRLIPVSDSYKGDSFFTVENGKRVATPLLLVLAVVELSDVVFAVDSIPAVSMQQICCFTY